MKKVLLLIIALVAASSAAMAATVDVSTARQKAERCVSRMVSDGRLMTTGTSGATLIKTELGDKAMMPVYYIFNTATCYVIVSGDDRAEEILAVGDAPLDINNIPTNMQAWLNGYKEQLDWLLCNPDAKVERASDTHVPTKATTYGPLLTCNWDQGAPYYNQCSFTYNGRTYQCYTGCPATSASQVLYYWKWPIAQVGPLPSYTNYLNDTYTYTYPALEATTFDWANMKDTYRTYTTAQANAVATLMRYVGQKEEMMYGTDGSGIYTTQTNKIVNMYKAFGYNQSTVRVVYKSNFTEANWASMLQSEMAEGRPVVYLATSGNAGHAFNVDGYRSSDNTYHVNFGWSGSGNGWCAMNAFSSQSTAGGSTYTFNEGQQMVIGIQPTDDYFDPTITVNPSSVTFSDCYATRTYTQTINVRGINLSGNINIAKSGSNVYSVSPTTISAEDASNGVDVTVTYAPTAAGNTTATLTLTSTGAPSKTVSISGTAQVATPTLVSSANSLSFMTGSNTTSVKDLALTGRFITNDVILTINDANGVFKFDNNSQTKTIAASSINETTPVNVVVSFNSASQGEFTGTMTIASSGAQSLTVNLSATADDSGTASDSYLNVAKYSTIEDAGWKTTYVNKLYEYTEYQNEGVAWLTLPVYGAWTASKNCTLGGTGTQNWITTNNANTHTIGTTYVNSAWDASDIYLGSGVYFTGSGTNDGTARRFGTSSRNNNTTRTITFYVTNATAVKLSGKNINATASNLRTYPTTLKVYKCTKNANGTITDGTSTITGGNLSNQTPSVDINFEVAVLDASEIYKVEVSLRYAQLYEIGFCTEIPSITTTPSSANISVGPSKTKTQTLTIKGSKINEDVTLTLNDPDNLFSISTTSVSLVDALAGTASVDVTFNGPEEYGDYTASLTLTSGEVTNTVPLNGTVSDLGTAHSDYLDIQKYYTLDENDWYGEYCVKPYEYTIDDENECAWLTMPAALSVYGWAYDDWSWHWANGANSDNPFYLYSGIDWDSMDVFKGCSPYFGSNTARVFGPPTLASGSTASATDYALLVYCVTNCDQVKAMFYNVAPDTDHPTEMEIYDITDGWNLDDNTFVEAWQNNTNSSDVVIESSEDLDPTKVYAVILLTYQGVVEEVAFRTPVQGTPKTPINVEADPGSTTAKITWTPGENNDAWNLRWRPYVDMLNQNRFWDFEDLSQVAEFTRVDNDGDGNNWGYGDKSSASALKTHSGNIVMLSASYDNNSGALTPDNWLITPKVKLGGSVSFWACGQDDSYPAEKFGVYVFQGDTWTSVGQFTQVGTDKTATATMTQYTFDLSAYSGPGYVAIVHHNVTDMFYLNVDDIEVLVPDAQEGLEEAEWTYCYDVASPYTIEGLTPETTYEVQVQGINAEGVVGNWTASTIFTTLPIASATLATIEGSGVKGETYTISDELVAVYANVDAGLLWCKDQGNQSIIATEIAAGQIDFMNDATLTDTTGQNGRAWDQSNWVALKFPADASISSLFEGIEGKKIKASTVTGKYVDNNNYTLEVQPVNGQYTLTFNGTASYTKNVYCAANFVESNLNTGGNTGAVGPHGDHYFFMNPKIQEVCEITFAMWDGEMFVTPNNTSIQGAFHVDWSRNSIGGMPTLQEGQTYRFVAVVCHPAKLSSMGGGDTPSDNYVVYPTNLTGDGNIVTGINGVYSGGHGEVVGVEYVNAAGIVSKTPFKGVNIIVTRYSDGTTTTVKKVFK